MKRLAIIDGNAILHRAYHALPPLTNRSGELVNAVYGFSTMLLKVVDDLKPDFLAVAFDTEKPTFRQMEYLGYQSQRPRMADELAGQIEKVHEVLDAFGIPIYAVPGFEADDVIGTLAAQAARINTNTTNKYQFPIETIIVTGDRDMMQLVGPKIKIYAPVRGMSEAEMFDEKKVEAKLGVPPKQVVDLKGLTGDASDNYPGVPGVGPKTASSLLRQYKTLPEIYKHLDDLPEVLSRKLLEGQELANLSQKLAKIVTNVPVKLNLEKCQFDLTEEEKTRVVQKFKELGFKSLVARFGGENKKFAAPKEVKSKSQKLKENSQQGLF